MSGDLTGWCERSEHGGCGGTLLTATGHHWWCACECHPAISEPNRDLEPDHHRAWETWRKAREGIGT